eukprot:jgi/Mesvir1/24251/Mv10954-RA.2
MLLLCFINPCVQDEHAAQSQVRMELRCESDLFFIYIADVDESHYAQLQDNQKLMVTFQEFPSILVRMLNNCIKEPHSHLAVFVTSPNAKHGRLDFIQNMDYKFVELLSLKFSAGSEDYVKRTISFRYNAVKSKFALMQSRLSDVNALVKLKNPGLLLQLQRSAAQSPAPAQPSPAASRSPSMINKSYLTPPRRPGTR